MTAYSFTYMTVAESEERMLDDLTAALTANGVEKQVSDRVKLVVSEAFTNALTHGNGWDPEKRIYVNIDINDERVSADITDEGQGAIERIRQRRPPEPLDEGGRGIDLIRHCTSDVVFQEQASGGLRVSIVVKRLEKEKMQR